MEAIMAVFVNQRQMLRQFLDEKGDEPYTNEEAADWCDARVDPEFWKPGQLDKALRRFKCRFLGHHLNAMQKAGKKARQRVIEQAKEKLAEAGKPVTEKAAAAMAADPGPVGRVKPRIYRERVTAEGEKRHEHTLMLNLKFDDGCKAIDKELELRQMHAVKAVELYNNLMAELPAAEKKKLRDRYKNNALFQQALSFVKESQAV
jgi:hypothetical protein